MGDVVVVVVVVVVVAGRNVVALVSCGPAAVEILERDPGKNTASTGCQYWCLWWTMAQWH